MAGGSLRDKVNAEKRELGELRRGLDTAVISVRPPSDAVMPDGGGHKGPTATPVPEPARVPTPAPEPVRKEEPAPVPAPVVAPAEAGGPKPTDGVPITFRKNGGEGATVHASGARSRPLPLFTDPEPTVAAPAPVPAPVVAPVEASGPKTTAFTRPGRPSRKVVVEGEALDHSPQRPAVAPRAPAGPASEGPMERFGMGGEAFGVPPKSDDPAWVPVLFEAPTRVEVPVPTAEPKTHKLTNVLFDLPGTKRKITTGCMLEYTGSNGDEYHFVLINTNGKKTSRENITLRVGDAPVNVDVRTKAGDATLSISLDSINKATKNISAIIKASGKTFDKLEKDAYSYRAVEFWANLSIKPYIPEIAFTTIFAAIDAALLYTGLGSNLLGGFQPLAVAGLALVQFGLVAWSLVHRSNTLDKEARTLEVKADAPRPA